MSDEEKSFGGSGFRFRSLHVKPSLFVASKCTLVLCLDILLTKRGDCEVKRGSKRGACKLVESHLVRPLICSCVRPIIKDDKASACSSMPVNVHRRLNFMALNFCE